MEIKRLSTINHPINKPGNSKGPSAKELFLYVLQKKNEYDEKELHWENDETVVVNDVSDLTLHSMVLEAEKHGKNVEFEKQIILRILD